MTPQTVFLVKIGLLGVFLLGAFSSGHRIGKNAVQAAWDSDRAIVATAQAKLIAENAKHNAEVQAEHDADNVRITRNHEQALKIISDQYDIDLAAVRARGLRIPKTTCGPGPARTETTSDSGHHEAPTESILLPEKITTDLFELAHDADVVVEQARACQNWISKSGFYGPSTFQ